MVVEVKYPMREQEYIVADLTYPQLAVVAASAELSQITLVDINSCSDI